MKKLTVLFIALMSLVVWYSSPAYADWQRFHDGDNLNARLYGEYAFVMTRICVTGSVTEQAPQLFTPEPDLTLLKSANPETRMLQGIIRYNGDGTGTVAGGRNFGVSSNQTQAGWNPVRQNEFECELTYTVHSYDKFTQWSNCTGVRVAGPGIGDLFENADAVLQGHISKRRKTLVLSDTDINVETFSRERDGRNFQRICGRSGTAVKIE